MHNDELTLTSIAYSKIRRLLKDELNSEDEVDLWLNSPNSLLGGVEPITLISSGSYTRILNLIENKQGE
jgi:hypothetical protein